MLRPSSFYNKELNKKLIVKDREDNLRKIEEMTRKIRTQSKYQEKERKGIFGSSSFEKFRSSFRGTSKNDAIRDWEQRQERKRNEKGLFATMDEKGYGNNSGSLIGWGESNHKEKVRTVYVPIRIDSKSPTTSRPASRASTALPPYKEGIDTQEYEDFENRKETKRIGIYPKCPSPDSDDEIEKAKLMSWIEFNENCERSVDKPTYLQKNRSATACSTPALGTVFE